MIRKYCFSHTKYPKTYSLDNDMLTSVQSNSPIISPVYQWERAIGIWSSDLDHRLCSQAPTIFNAPP